MMCQWHRGCIVDRKYLQVVSSMTEYKNKAKDIHVKNHFLNARVKILENENIMIQNMVVTLGQGA